jgi:glycosyltransferase involved in cell wall biosynthesis
MRLTLVTETFPPEVNGVALTLGRWVDAFRARGHVVRVIRPRQPVDAAAAEYVHGLPLPFYPGVRLGIVSPVRLRTMLLRSAPDLVHIATEGPLGAAALMASVGMNVPLVSSFHTNFDHYLPHYGFAGFEPLVATYLAWFHNQTAVTLAPGAGTCRRLASIGVARSAVWSRGVDAEAFHPRYRDASLRRELGLADDSILLLYVGRLAAEKNLGALLDLYDRWRGQLGEAPRDRVKLVLVGKGPLAGRLALRQSSGVTLAGEKRGADLARWYSSADVFVFPSRSETFGNAVLEAQASGLPVIGYDCQAVNERISHQIDGILAATDRDFAAAVELLCNHPDLRARFGAAARAKAERQSWSGIFDELEALYRQIIDSRPASGVMRVPPLVHAPSA